MEEKRGREWRSIGWKGIHAAAILYDEYMVRVECGSSYSDEDKAN